MRKMILAFTCILVMACNLGRVASTPGQPGTVEQQVPTPNDTQASEATAAALSIPSATPSAPVEATATPIAVVPIPVISVQIEGMPYNAYQIPGDPFRFVCPDPCPLDPQYIYAEYAGFRAAYAKLIQLTGIDTLTRAAAGGYAPGSDRQHLRGCPLRACLCLFKQAPSIHLH